MAKLIPYYFLLFLLVLVAQNNTVSSLLHKNEDSSSFLDPEITKFCPKEDTMFIKGTDVKISDFVRTNGDIYNLCSYRVDLKQVNVFALNSIVIDVDVSSTNLTMFFIAPKWVVIGNRKISVDGSMGDYVRKAEDGNDSNIDGQDGRPGLPGGPGGNFFGIGESFVNGKMLTITANGGTGGTGQYGGNGFNQVNGRYVDIRAIGKIWCGLYYDICKGKDKEYQLNLLDNLGNYSDFYCQGLYEKENMASCSYKIFGWNGEEGGKGGNGGRGGKGGLSGSVTLIDLKNSSQVSTYNILGNYGKDGKGGTGGKSGRNGHNVIYEDLYFLAPPKVTLEQEYHYRHGPNGSAGYNTDGYRDDLENAFVLKPLEILSTINQYKSWLRKNWYVNIEKFSDFSTFYKHMDENTYVRNLYITLDLFDEVRSLDEELFNLTSTVGFISFYDYLLERIYFYVESYENDRSREEDRQILCLLYTEILGRIYNFDEHADTYLAIEIPPYLESVKDNLKDIGDLLQENSTFDVIVEKVNELSKYKENYKDQVQELIIKSKQYVNGKITMAMETLMKDEEMKMRELVNDIIRFKERPINYEQELLACGKILQDSLVVRSNLFSFKLISEVFSVLSDFAEVVSSVVEIGAKVPRVLRLEEELINKTEFSGELLTNLYNRIEAIKVEEVASISELAKNILNKTRNYLEILFDVSEEVHIVKKKLQSNNRFHTVNALRSDLLQAVKIKIPQLTYTFNLHSNGNINFKAYKRTETARLAFIELNRIISINILSRGFFYLYNEYKHDAIKLDIIIEHIGKMFNILRKQKSLEDSIYNVLYELLQQMEDNIVLVTSGTSDSISKLAFEVVKWNIPLTLDSIRQKAQQLTDNSQSKSYLVKILEDLEGACSTFTEVFQRIKKHFQQSKLENHIVDTTISANKGMAFTNVPFTKKYEEIKKALGSHLVLQYYKKAADTFKQYVFPVADVYFKDIILPSHFNMYDDTANIVSTALTQIDKMLKKVEEYKDTVLNGGGIIERKEFGGRNHFGSAKPFFSWRNEQYKGIITKLLSGEEVTVYADINNSEVRDHAVKFNRIDFYFTSNNETIQKSVNNIMESFKIYVSHLGNSFYRYDDDIYLIKSDVFKMFYYFENDEYGDPIKTSGSYDYVKNVDITLSPYTLWKVRLAPLWKEVSFDDLLIFKDKIDLELGGNGFYVSNDKIRSLDLKVKKYYKPLDKDHVFYSEPAY